MIEIGKSVHKIPHNPVAGVEDMGAIGVHVDAVPVVRMAVAAQMGPLIDHQTAQARVAGEPSESSPVQAAANDQIVVGSLDSGIGRFIHGLVDHLTLN